MTDIIKIQEEINTQLANKEVFNALVTTTFKGLAPQNVKKAIMEGMMRGFTFKDFLEKNVYAVPFKESYSLVTSLDHARKVGMRSGVIGKSAPGYAEKDGKIIACSVTIKRKVGEDVGDYTSTVFFDEYNTGRNLWATKPRTMIAKVAEMHALRMACPEELSQSYAEEEMATVTHEVQEPKLEISSYEQKLSAVRNIDELKQVWASLPIQAKKELDALKDSLKLKYANS